MRQHDDGKVIIKVTLSILFLIVIIGYGAYQSTRIVSGPKIELDNVLDGTSTSTPLLTVGGIVKNTSTLEINGRQVFTDEKGYFAEKILLYSGYNVISLQAKDKFGATVVKQLEIIYQQSV